MFDDLEPIYTYTERQAEDDGFLVNVKNLIPDVGEGLISHATTNLLNKGGYMREGKPDIPTIMDLMYQAETIILVQKILNKGQVESFYSGKIQTPNKKRVKIFIEQNETWHFTILLPEDH